MHPALEIPEIVLSVCNALVAKKEDATGDGPYDVHARALAACAQTCRAFYMPAIMALWKYDDLMLETILLHCMPEDVWDTKPNTQGDAACSKLIYPKCPILPADAERLLFYAPLVNKLIVGWPVDGKFTRVWEAGLSKEGYEAVSSVLPHPAFVNMRHLIWYTGGASLSHIQQYLSPSLSSLTLKLTRAARPHISLLSDLADRCPFVTSFNLDTDDYSEGRGEVEVLHSRLIRAWDLHSLDSCILDHSSLIYLAQSPHLTQLVNDRGDTLSWIPLSLPHKPFASLCYLHLRNIDMRLCMDLVQACTFTALRRLELFPFNPAAGDWKRLYTAIRAAHAQPQLLYSLEIEQWGFEETNVQGDPVTEDDIVSLLDFTELSTLSLETLGGFDLEPATLERMATTWPAMKMLSLRGVVRPEWQRRLTLYALVPLAMHCPKLNNLELEFDGTGVSFDQNPPRPDTPSPLTALAVKWSPINSSRAVAAFLSVYFPHLRHVEASDELPGKRWGRVGELVPVFSKIREHERMEAAGRAPPLYSWKITVDDCDLHSESSSDEEDE
ncbi:hypothetical protein BD626DRAFT_573762 [Schizophyllum amplum]|uniref:F-box domain-containing protein n=1 Tax=Schizophyllum amplum TaxID=97359 RepID=A0A550C0N2_9AGAR|nr:hypothetical protein BD626DRAFT_573762 [Auriculariopsis ampla]